MRAALPFLLAAAALPAQSAGDASIELAVARGRYFVSERIDLTLRVGMREEFVRENLIQVFRRALDFPVRIDAPWLPPLVGTTTVTTAPVQTGPTLVLEGGMTKAVRESARTDERLVVSIRHSFVADRPGRIVLPPARLHFSHATRFEEDLLGGRVAADRTEAVVEARGRTLAIVPLPEAGRPAGFSGAVGSFAVRATTDRDELVAGESLDLTLTVTGGGNLQLFAAPELALPGFHVRGRIESKRGGERRITWDVTPLSDRVKAVPAIPFSFFEPRSASYRTVRAEAIPLEVHPPRDGPLPAVAKGEPRVVPGRHDIHDIKAPGPPPAGRVPTALLLLGLLVPWVLLAGLLSWRGVVLRIRERREAARVRGAAARFRTRAAHDTRDALVEFLAVRLGLSRGAVIGPALEERLAATGVSSELVARTTSLIDELLAERFGCARSSGGASRATSVVEELDREIPWPR